MPFRMMAFICRHPERQVQFTLSGTIKPRSSNRWACCSNERAGLVYFILLNTSKEKPATFERAPEGTEAWRVYYLKYTKLYNLVNRTPKLIYRYTERGRLVFGCASTNGPTGNKLARRRPPRRGCASPGGSGDRCVEVTKVVDTRVEVLVGFHLSSQTLMCDAL